MNSPATNLDVFGDETMSAVIASTPVPAQTLEYLRRRDEALVALGRRAIAAPGWRMLAYDAAALVAETLQADQFAVVECSDDRTTLTIRIAEMGRHRDESHSSTAQIACSESTSLAGYALALAQPVAVADLSAEKHFRDAFLRQRGLRSAAAIPLLRGSASFGALLIASSKLRQFTADEVQYFETIAHLVSTTIAHERAREALDMERRFQAAVLESTASLMLVLSPGGKILQMNRAAVKSFGFDIDEAADRTQFEAILAPEELPMVQEAFQQVTAMAGPMTVECWAVAKSGQRRRVQWTLAGLTDSADRLERMVLTGIDITRQHEIEAELAEVRKNQNSAATPVPFGVLPTGGPANRRKRDRRAFPYMQMVAPLVDGLPPEAHQYQPYHCRDISSVGFSFFAPSPPEVKNLMLALGSGGTVVYLSGRITHSTQIKRKGKVAYVVGCQFHSRIKLDDVIRKT